MNRFRPNIVLAGLEPYDEDHIDTLAVDGVVIKLVKPCARCQITTTDQDSTQIGASRCKRSAPIGWTSASAA